MQPRQPPLTRTGKFFHFAGRGVEAAWHVAKALTYAIVVLTIVIGLPIATIFAFFLLARCGWEAGAP